MKKDSLPAPIQGNLELNISAEKEVTINGIEMGVLENGIPYLTQTGLANVCGVHRSVLQELTEEWGEAHNTGLFSKSRLIFIRDYLNAKGFNEKSLYIAFKKNGNTHYAYPDIVCMAILEFYAFESPKQDKSIALKSYRDLAGFGLREYIYKSTGYTPADPWKHYHDRVSLLKNMGSVPEGYFIVFNEIAGMMVDLINAGLVINQHTVPDISVGIAWANYWKENNFDIKFGNYKRCLHNYPDDFAQSKSNPQDIKAYPDSSLPEFRLWFKNCYLKTKFPNYILKKTMLLPQGKETATKLIEVLQ